MKQKGEPGIKQRFGLAIKQRRGEIGISQEELAFRCGLHRTYISDIEIDINQQTDACIIIFSLPNSRLASEGTDEVSSKFISLFSSDEFVSPLKQQIFLPSPDYTIVDISNNKLSKSAEALLNQQAKNPDSLEIYNLLKGKLQVEEIKAAVSLKTSNRPDRRYQPLFEAATIKAMGYVLQQNWKYYRVASELTSADRTIFSTAVAPHGIAMERNFKLVDGTYLYT